MSTIHQTVKEAVEELQAMGFSCEAGPLENSVAFLELVSIASKPEPRGTNFARLENDFSYHAINPAQRAALDTIRTQLRQTAHIIDFLVPNGREKSEVFSLLEKAMFHANAGVSRHGVSTEGSLT